MGLGFTRDLLEPIQLRQLTRYVVGSLAKKVHVSCEWEDRFHLGSGLREGHDQRSKSVNKYDVIVVYFK